MYIELRGRSAFSFGDGAVAPEALAARGAELGYPALGLTDAADLGGSIRFALEAEKAGLRPLVGAELRVEGRPAAFLARDEAGYRNLAGLITQARLQNPRGQPTVSWSQLVERSAGLHALTGPPTGRLATLVRQGRRAEAELHLAHWREIFGERLAVEVQRHNVSAEEAGLGTALIELAERTRIPWVVTNEPRYLDGAGRLVHDLQTANRAELEVGAAAERGLLLPNGEWRLKSPEEMACLWCGREQGLAHSMEIAEQCSFSLRWLRPPLPRFPLPPRHDDDSFLREKAFEGARKRWGEVGDAERRQLDHELGVIQRLGFAGFFLVMWQAVQFARSRGILCQGRGSAANSAVAFCLEITAVDPVKHGLLFERFLSEARTDGLTEAPDIDVDFEMDRREEVLDYIYGIYSRQHAAITCVTQMYHAPSALQDMMRALGYPAELAFKFSKRMHGRSPADGAELLEKELADKFALSTRDARGRALLTAMRALQDVPRMRSTHPGGFVLSRAPLGDYLPIERTTMGRTILQFDKDDLDAAGVPKFDFLGLGGLSAVRKAFDVIEARTGKQLELYSLPQDDPKTYAMISRGETLGTFQIESRAQIQSLVHTKPEKLYDLVVQVALIRPGPIQARFVHPYTRRRRGLERVTYAHPALEPILKRTQGIPIFQEQAMALSMVLGGFTPAEADELRRAMGHQRKLPRLQAQFERLRGRMVAMGIDDTTAEQIIEDLRGFANYGFPESHAWSFALIAYATAYLKAHHPAEFLLGLLNAWPMGFYAPGTLVQEARRAGVNVRGPCLKHGTALCTLEETDDLERPAMRLGWKFVNGIGDGILERLEAARRERPFDSVEDAVRRAELGPTGALQLARAGAFEALEPGRRKAAWEALRAAGDTLPLAPALRLPFDPTELEGDELVFLDYLATGISVRGHPMQHLRERLRAAGVCSSHDLLEQEDDIPIVVAGLVVARQHPATAKGTVFLLLEDEWGFINVIIPPRLYERQREVVNFSPFLLIEGTFEREESVLNVVARRFRTLGMPEIAYRSRNFR